MVELTKYGTQTNYKIPPESTGARVAHHEHWYFYVTGLDDHFIPPATYVLGSSGIYGTVVNKQAFDGGYRLLVTAALNSPLSGFVIDEVFTITDLHGVHAGVLRGFDAVLLPTTAIVDAEKPDRHLSIDSLGAASVRFTEGEPTFDAYGLIRMSEPARLSEYVFRYDTNSTAWQQRAVGTGTLSHLPSQSSIALDVSTAAGDEMTYTTNRAHRYTPGVSHLVTMSVHAGDTGKSGCVRRWGLFNDRNGLFFELNGSELAVVCRSSVSGTPVDDRHPQSVWNVDRVNGSFGEANPSGMNINPSFQNVYWFDFQWHGAGVVRFGTFTPSGKRIVIHTIEHANEVAGPYMETATLPFRVSIENTTATASPSRFVLTACAQFKEGEVVDDGRVNNSVVRSYTAPGVEVNGTGYVCVGAFRASGTLNGVPNHKAVVPKALNYYCDKDVHVVVKGGTVLDGSEVWTSAALGSAAEAADGPLTAVFEGVSASGLFMNAGAYTQQVSDSFNSTGQNLHSMADGTSGTMYTTWVKCMDPAATATFHTSVDWVEL